MDLVLITGEIRPYHWWIRFLTLVRQDLITGGIRYLSLVRLGSYHWLDKTVSMVGLDSYHRQDKTISFAEKNTEKVYANRQQTKTNPKAYL